MIICSQSKFKGDLALYIDAQALSYPASNKKVTQQKGNPLAAFSLNVVTSIPKMPAQLVMFIATLYKIRKWLRRIFVRFTKSYAEKLLPTKYRNTV